MNEPEGPIASLWSTRDLPMLPKFIRSLISKAKTELGVQKIVLFGSRARGDFSPQSDYDLCFYSNPDEPFCSDQWARFVIEFEESKETLCSIDFINYSETHSELRQEIDKTGIVLYEQK